MFAKLHHAAYRCADAAETVHFYQDILGLPFAHALSNDYVPSIKIYAPHIHIFFQLKDGSYIAFFEVPLGGDLAKVDRCQHIAFEVEDRDTLLANKARLQAHGIDVVGVTDHHFCNSIYFFDPTGHRLEMTIRTMSEEQFNHHRSHPEPEAILQRWQERRTAENWPERARGTQVPVTS
ncbi:MAG: VOC family protein [Betaproteobacteria bacterium]|nr:VOC family protein [Betaproteobacteria bacterium]